jgi:hypothetical protein
MRSAVPVSGPARPPFGDIMGKWCPGKDWIATAEKARIC